MHALLKKLLLAAAVVALPAASFGSVFISVGFAPPALPVYAQPICPGDGYLWTPGYWAYSDEGYYWVPGVWVQPPSVGVLWTPGYWGWGGSAFIFHAGYWGPHIGFYGGVNYGFGYGGVGYEGGYWNHGAFAYNRSVNNINVTNVHNVYNKTVIVNNNTTINRVSYNGGNGGLQARPSPQEQAAIREQHFQPTANQMTHQQNAMGNRQQFAAVNHGQPPMAAQARIGDHSNVVPARGFQSQPNNGAQGQRGFAGTPNAARPANTVNGRENNQQQRIANGVGNGQMTAGEAGRAEQRQQNINNQVRADRQANGGQLNQQQHQQVQREQNRASQQIRNDNHNEREQRPAETHEHNH